MGGSARTEKPPAPGLAPQYLHTVLSSSRVRRTLLAFGLRSKPRMRSHPERVAAARVTCTSWKCRWRVGERFRSRGTSVGRSPSQKAPGRLPARYWQTGGVPMAPATQDNYGP